MSSTRKMTFLLIGVGLLLLFSVLLFIFSDLIGFMTVLQFVRSHFSDLGINPYIADAVAVLAVPLILVTLRLFLSRDKKKKLYGGILLTIILFSWSILLMLFSPAERIEQEGLPVINRVYPDVNSSFFDKNGKPLVYYYHNGKTKEFEFYAHPGVHPQLGVKLQPITREIAATVLKQLQKDSVRNSPNSKFEIDTENKLNETVNYLNNIHE